MNPVMFPITAFIIQSFGTGVDAEFKKVSSYLQYTKVAICPGLDGMIPVSLSCPGIPVD
jgi:hypothetical protein